MHFAKRQVANESVTRVTEEVKKESDKERDFSDAFEFSRGVVTKYIGHEYDVVIPSSILGEEVKGIENTSMRGRSPEKWPRDRNGPFEKSDIEAITIPSTLEFIGDLCFYECQSLVKFEFSADSHLKTIGNWAFRATRLRILILPSSLESIGDWCFAECYELIRVIFGRDCRLKRIGESAFRKSGIETIALPSSLESIGYEGFYECRSLTTVEISSNSHLMSIEGDAFRETGLETICLPLSLKALGKGCFDNCVNLKSIRVPSGFRFRNRLPQNIDIET